MGRNSKTNQQKPKALPIDSITNTLNQAIDPEVYKDSTPIINEDIVSSSKNNTNASKNVSNNQKIFSFQNNDSEGVRKTYVVDSSIDNAIESIVTDKRTGKKIPGTKGFISKLVNNALRKELVSLGILPPSELEKNENY
ncbi:hypothetical protein HCJ58_15010 [Listeria sp. FSL L7-1509]|uniref:Uncharacterized protein n=1 Tax=Listeria immobilis TaxID=2713502 RepID=A0ABR6T034_9LIST|nr:MULTISPECIES: hypothetical protein [Listeria]MBC1484520.1 hypothetical protein [Listeria immobilis]MBC1508261.1 hypothetical protein [Listeria immobilis]MBC1511286.1 hypothetical protein [Listeria immobilis]MBC1839522.1 hypothetical protein [Listeria seeligeri]MBC6313688.1 hypothetical protein [Listeria immobilis]